jgi:hypothetical protein
MNHDQGHPDPEESGAPQAPSIGAMRKRTLEADPDGLAVGQRTVPDLQVDKVNGGPEK